MVGPEVPAFKWLVESYQNQNSALIDNTLSVEIKPQSMPRLPMPRLRRALKMYNAGD